MSVHLKHYLVIGVDIGYDNVDDEQYEKYEDIMDPDLGNFGCIFDGMNGDYVILGKVLDMALDYEGLNLNKLSVEKIKLISEEIKMELHKFGISEEPQVIAFTHAY